MSVGIHIGILFIGKEKRQCIVEIFRHRPVLMTCTVLFMKSEAGKRECIRKPCHRLDLHQSLAVGRIVRSACRPDVKIRARVGRLPDNVREVRRRFIGTVHAGEASQRPAVGTDRHEVFETGERVLQRVPRRYSSHRKTSDSAMLARSFLPCGIRTFGVCAVTALHNGNKVVHEFLRQRLAIRICIGIVDSRLSVIITRRHDNGRSHISVFRHVVEQFTQQSALGFEYGRRCAVMPVYEIKYIVASVRIHVVLVRQIYVCRIRACRARTFGIVARVVVDSYYFASMLRLLLVSGRNGDGFVHQFRVALRTVGSFRLFLFLSRR